MSITFTSALHPPAGPARPALWFLFRGQRLLVQPGRVPAISTPDELGLTPRRARYLGRLENGSEAIDCYCGDLADETEAPAGFTFESLRPLYAQLDETTFWLAGRAIQIVEWERTHQYCGRCGHPTVDHERERSKLCPQCGLTSYPRLAPAIIVRVQRHTSTGPEILLARAQRFPTGFFSVLAGFVEPGETLEECVRREVFEETGILVDKIEYFGSQPWPFPHSLMIGFTAEYAAGELTIDAAELAEAGWFAAGALPAVPPPPSIANRLIVAWLEENRHDEL
jgi:NAD+ diphosphatase